MGAVIADRIAGIISHHERGWEMICRVRAWLLYGVDKQTWCGDDILNTAHSFDTCIHRCCAIKMLRPHSIRIFCPRTRIPLSRPFTQGRAPRASTIFPLLRRLGSKAVPYAVGVTLLWLGYEHITHGPGEHSFVIFRQAYAESSEGDDSRRIYAKLKKIVKSGIADEDDKELPILALANKVLKQMGQSISTEWGRVDSCNLPSNSVTGEDRMTITSSAMRFPDGTEEKLFGCGIYDGHAGHSTAIVLQRVLHEVVLQRLTNLHAGAIPNMPGARPDSQDINDTIRESFIFVDAMIMATAEAALENPDLPLGSAVAVLHLAPALSGSCALFALFEPATSVLRVANVGDSRAVLGRANFAGNYSPIPLSTDHTGFNPSEVARITAEHLPGEKIIDPKTGRVHGIAVSRAFGDARWKWTDDMMKDAEKRFWAHGPRPGGVIKTPPYLTAEPEITETKIKQDQSHPDFLIMASDGFWDHMSNENAVLLVQKWLEAKGDGRLKRLDQRIGNAELRAEVAKGSKLDQDLFYSEEHGELKWRIEPKHFVVEDENCATHLLKNVLGGSRRSLFCGVFGLEPPLSRDVRDDITINVVFFGQV